MHAVKLTLPEGRVITVNPLMVGAVQASPDRKSKVDVVVGPSLFRVVGTEDEVLAALGWAEAPPAADAPATVSGKVVSKRKPADGDAL